MKTRKKLVIEKYGGTCAGYPSEVEECDIKKCPGTLQFVIHLNKS